MGSYKNTWEYLLPCYHRHRHRQRMIHPFPLASLPRSTANVDTPSQRPEPENSRNAPSQDAARYSIALTTCIPTSKSTTRNARTPVTTATLPLPADTTSNATKRSMRRVERNGLFVPGVIRSFRGVMLWDGICVFKPVKGNNNRALKKQTKTWNCPYMDRDIKEQEKK